MARKEQGFSFPNIPSQWSNEGRHFALGVRNIIEQMWARITRLGAEELARLSLKIDALSDRLTDAVDDIGDEIDTLNDDIETVDGNVQTVAEDLGTLTTRVDTLVENVEDISGALLPEAGEEATIEASLLNALEYSFTSAADYTIFTGYNSAASEGGWYGYKHTNAKSCCGLYFSRNKGILAMMRDSSGNWKFRKISGMF